MKIGIYKYLRNECMDIKRNVGCRWHFPNCDTLKMYHMAREDAAASSLVFL